MAAKYRILYVNSELPLLETGKQFLEKNRQFSVDIITSAPAALSLLKSKDFDAIISDYKMPEMDGIEFLKTVRSSGSTIPFIIFTEQEQEEVVLGAIDHGADFYSRRSRSPETQFSELVYKIQIAVEHQRTLEKILSLNRLYSVLSASNKAVVHLRTKDEFFSEICRILVEIGGFRMAWIGLADPEYKIIRPITSAGHVNGYLDTITISTEDIPSGRGPTGTAFRKGKYFFSNDIACDPRMEPWRENALKHGYLASAAFPFALKTKNAGIITIYAPVTGFFDDRTIVLLKEVSETISFALETLDQIEQRRSAEEALRTSEEHLQLFIQYAPAALAMFDRDMRYLAVSNRWIADYELGDQKILGRSHYKIFPEITESWKAVHRRGLAGEVVHADEDLFVRMDGTVQWLSWDVRPWYTPEKTVGGIVIFSEDITSRKHAEEVLMQNNENLNALNEELSLREEELIKSEADLKEALSEKEVLLSEIHHRVKNNLTAFISLLSLDGSYEDTEAGRSLRKDLQNRARSMALIHETLYRTGKFSNVDMGIYLENLISQVVGSYGERSKVRTVIDVRDVALEIGRATTAGLIINELVTNSFKYAFPPGFDCMAIRGEPCTIRVSLAHMGGTNVLTVADNGCGLPEGFDPLKSKSLGLKLVNFLARHQLHADIDVMAEKGTKFIFHLKNTDDKK
ncbi:histidine kinase dimerization/phosphoacceptor domain -containing protein [Methanoregula sp.]|uniref:histidine kinase dimerization/phosphoacceptor domain -containing protein n=1 Tax=Methanoregula sp. TaxID=2052170 RepID=UPI003C762F5F